MRWQWIGALAFFSLVSVLVFAGPVYAQSSLGIGGAEQPAMPTGGPFSGLFLWIANEQREFYRAMTEALRSMREDGSAFWVLVGLSFLYGILHAAGPGHGKVVISSYMLANETALRRGVLLSFASSALQGISALVLVGAGFAVLRSLSVSTTQATVWLEIASYVAVLLFGLWLLWRKLNGLWSRSSEQVAETINTHYHPTAVVAHAGHGHARHQNEHAQVHDPHHHEHSHDHGHHHHAEGEVCATCGHAHMPMASDLEGKMDLRSALAAVFAVGLRPCTGAIVVLSFALLNSLYIAGIVSVFAMSIGTAITVSALATIAVTAKNLALRLSGSALMGSRLQTAIEIFGATLLVLLGGALLAGALTS